MRELPARSVVALGYGGNVSRVSVPEIAEDSRLPEQLFRHVCTVRDPITNVSSFGILQPPPGEDPFVRRCRAEVRVKLEVFVGTTSAWDISAA